MAQAWRHGNARQRTALATIGLLASIVALVLVISLVRFVSWRAEVHQARAEQQQLVERFDFNPGNIISNTQFFNGSAMNQKEIQAFLDEKGAECTERGCLRNATFSTEPRAASDYCTEYKGRQTEGVGDYRRRRYRMQCLAEGAADDAAERTTARDRHQDAE